MYGTWFQVRCEEMLQRQRMMIMAVSVRAEVTKEKGGFFTGQLELRQSDYEDYLRTKPQSSLVGFILPSAVVA